MSVEDRLDPEQRARVEIDRLLEAAGWLIQDRTEMNLRAAIGLAVREFQTARGPADYLLFVERRAVGSVEAKRLGLTLSTVETQGDRYMEGFREKAAERGLKFWGTAEQPLPFHYMSTGAETLFASRRDPVVRPREVFAFHRPETLKAWSEAPRSMRASLRTMPPLATDGLRDAQIDAIEGLERSLRDDKPRALISMATGAGKTFTAVTETFRFVEYAKATRVLFLVDRLALGRQAYDAFRSFQTPGDGRKFTELHGVQLLRSNRIDPAAKVVITTIQRLYSILRGDPEFDETLEEESAFETQAGLEREPPKPVSYQPAVPIETFDVIFTDECHRSIYGRWGEVLDYFDAFLVGMTATPSAFTYGYFQGNLVSDYSYAESVRDGVNVDYTVFRIDTEVTRTGSTVARGETVQVRNTQSRQEAFAELDDELTYDAAKLDRAVVAPDQIRTVIRAFRDRIGTEIFPGRTEVPKTIVFCKNDSHAEDVLEIIRTEFARGSEFAKKITYRAAGRTEDLVRSFTNDPAFRIAVSVDQMSTGTDVKPVECLLFMRMVNSRILFEQMKGRGVRTIDADRLQSVTPDARVKDHFVIVDAVGITDEGRAWAVSKPLDQKPSVSLKTLLQQVAEGSDANDLVSTVGARLLRLDRRLTDEQREQVEALLPGGQTLHDVAAALVDAADEDRHRAIAEQLAGEGETPTEEQVEEVRERLADDALAPLADAAVRNRILEIQTQSQQVIDLITRDEVVFAGFTDFGEAERAVETFQEFIEAHHDEYVALQAFFEQPVRRRLALKDIRELALAIEAPPVGLTPEKLWKAYEKLDASKVHGSGGRMLTDMVSLVRFATETDPALIPHADAVRVRFDAWLTEQQSTGREFSAEQMRWLTMVAEHIAASMTIEPDDFDLDPFAGEGGLDATADVFGEQFNALLDELNAVLAEA